MLVHSELVNGLGKLTEATRFRQAQAGDCDALNGLMAEHDGLVHAVVQRQANGFGDVLSHRLNRLPLPSLSLLDDMAQTWEGEVKGKHQALLSRSPVQKPAPGDYYLLRNKIDCSIPLWLLQMDGMEQCIGNA